MGGGGGGGGGGDLSLDIIEKRCSYPATVGGEGGGLQWGGGGGGLYLQLVASHSCMSVLGGNLERRCSFPATIG